MEAEINVVTRKRDAEAAALLADAFAAETHFRRFFDDNDARRQESVGRYFAAGCAAARRMGLLFLAATRGDRLLGVATVAEPIRYRPPPALARAWTALRWKRMIRKLGCTASMQAYSRACGRMRLPFPATYVSYLGVRPDEQAQGIGRRLLDAAYALAYADPWSNGVLLHTVNPRLAASLERRGWVVGAQPATDDLVAHWCLRPLPPPPRT